ncbi:MAG: cation:proton antiporter [Erysipelotrichaceae bacterium]|nr:cation:proton antiporter [Erysipelotrichaceae bacterium]
MFVSIEAFEILLPLALILFVSKLLSIGSRKLGVPQVMGLLLTGVLLGLVTLIPNQGIFTDSSMEGIAFIAEIGVILIMFSAGLETDLKQIKETGFAASIITILGVIVPLGLGYLASLVLPAVTDANGNIDTTKTLFRNLFYGVILTATSVSVTIATLKELGKFKTKIGTAIVSAAILDDIIGVIILSVIISLDGAMTSSSQNVGADIALVIGKTLLFFVFAIGFGILLRWIFKKLTNKYDHHRRMVIFAIAAAFFYAYAAEKWFGIADITGAFFAGLMLSGIKETNYIEKKTEVTSYLIFTPVFFAKVGLTSISSFSSINLSFLLFGVLFILAGILGKLLGCGLGARLCKYDFKDSLRCGVGMMCRAEVCLICAQKGIDAGIIDASIQPFILVLILLTSFITPIVLKNSYRGTFGHDIDDIIGLINPEKRQQDQLEAATNNINQEEQNE